MLQFCCGSSRSSSTTRKAENSAKNSKIARIEKEKEEVKKKKSTETTRETKTATIPDDDIMSTKNEEPAVDSLTEEVEEDDHEEEEDEEETFVISPKYVTVGSSFKVQYKRPEGGGPDVKGWIGLYRKGEDAKSYFTHYYDTDDTLSSSIDWSKGPNRSGEWEFRYYDGSYNLLASSMVTAVSETIHCFNKTYPSKDNRVTIDSKQVQSSFWPDYLPEDNTRLFVMERSKNPSLVVYYANLRFDNSYPYVRRNRTKISKSTEFDKDEPIRVRWYSWGWTKEPEINSLNMFQMQFMGTSMKPKGDNEFTGILNALKEKTMKLCICIDPKTSRPIPALVGIINGKNAILRKVFVKTESNWAGLPSVMYADIYGIDLEDGRKVEERLKQK